MFHKIFLTLAAVGAFASPVSAELKAEDQTPTGKFTTAAEVKMILTATKSSWVAVRLYEGHDLIYFTQLLAWRCGLVAMEYAINGGPMQPFGLPECHIDTASPNALIGEEGMPIMGLPPESVQSIDIKITYDDLTTDSASYMRAQVLMP